MTTQAIGPLLDAARVKKGVKLLDIASGPGYVAAAAAKRGARAMGIDTRRYKLLASKNFRNIDSYNTESILQYNKKPGDLSILYNIPQLASTIIAPVNVSNTHWTLFCGQINGIAEIIDPLGDQSHFLPLAMERAKVLVDTIDQSTNGMIMVIKLPTSFKTRICQSNSDDCGPMICGYAEKIMTEDKNVAIDIEMIRQKVLDEHRSIVKNLSEIGGGAE